MSLKSTNVCVVNDAGKIVRQANLACDPEAIELFLVWGMQLKRVGLEAFSFSAWLCDALDDKGLPIVCILSDQTGSERDAEQDRQG